MPARHIDLTLSDGATCRVIPANRFVRMAAGPPPKSLVADAKKGTARAPRAGEAAPAEPPEDRTYTPDELDWLLRSQKLQLVHCVSVLTAPNGFTRRLVQKPFSEATPAEQALDALPEEDLALLLDTLNEFDKEVAATAATFPAPPPQGTPQPRRPRDEVWEAPQPTPRAD